MAAAEQLVLDSILGTFPVMPDAAESDALDDGEAAVGAATPVVPALSSLPGSFQTLYLDFDGHTDASWGSYSNIVTPPYSSDADTSTFSSSELLRINQVWAQVAEDYAPFKINVTTVEPASFANNVSMRIVIGGDGAWSGGTYGGLAYINSFTNGIPNSVYVFAKNLNSAKNISEASSHEAGHSFGLQHQSQYDSNGVRVAEYYAGNGDGRAPIMGLSYSATRGLWWRGTSTSAGTTQDDMSVISRGANGFGYRPDDHGNNVFGATALATVGDQASASGVITQTSDVDYFSFDTAAGQVSFTLSVPASNNLDGRLELRDAVDTLIASAAPTNSFGATLSATVPAGSFRVVVASHGNYGDVGQYTLSGTIALPQVPPAAPFALEATAASATEVDLVWVDAATNESAYGVERSTDGQQWIVLTDSLPADSASFIDATAVGGTSYHYRVQAINATTTSAYSNEAVVTTPILFLVGDMNADGLIDNFDFAPFELALADRGAFAATYPAISDILARGDVSGNGVFDNFDIEPFEELLANLGWAQVGDAAQLAQGASTATLNPYEPGGNFVLRPGVGPITLPTSLLENPNIAGFVLRDRWSNVNPAPGVYDWSRLDAAVQGVTDGGQVFKLTIFTGVEAPEWLYSQGAEPFFFTAGGDFRPPGHYRMPVPWDATMLRYYGELLAEMDRHFGGNASLVSVSLAGPTQFSTEMHLPATIVGLPGYSSEAISGAWRTVLTTYAGLFPNVRGSIHLSPPVDGAFGIAQQVAQDAVDILGARAMLQHDALSAKPGLESYNIHQLVASYAGLGVHTGYEELSASSTDRFGGSFDVAWQRLLTAGGKYLDLYAPDDVLARAFPNSAPSFVTGPNPIVDGDGVARVISNWAQEITAGPSSERTQSLAFAVIGNSRPDLFLVPPTVDAVSGALEFTPALNVSGAATVTLRLRDDGGTASGGVDNQVQSFAITIAAAVMQNPSAPLDVNADGLVSPNDSLIIINELNRRASGASAGALPGAQPTFFLDVSGDGRLSPLDALLVINHLNDRNTFGAPLASSLSTSAVQAAAGAVTAAEEAVPGDEALSPLDVGWARQGADPSSNDRAASTWASHAPPTSQTRPAARWAPETPSNARIAAAVARSCSNPTAQNDDVMGDLEELLELLVSERV